MGNNELEAVLQAADAKRAEYQAELCELLRIPSVSAVAAHADDVRRAGRWVADRFERMGFDCELVETGGHPIVVAERCDVPDAPTALVYGHYDVQPPDPLSEWITPPFEPTERDGNLFARGATDDKGQMLTHVFSAEAWLEAAGRLPVNLKYVIEGEEETGSPHLEEFVREHTDRLAADVVVISDTCQFAPGQPAITYGLRGVTYFELRLSGPKQDLHSGTFGGAVLNPLNALAKLLAAISDEKGRVQLDGFYDDVVSLTDAQRSRLADLSFNDESFRRKVGVKALGGEAGYSTLERRWARPTYDVCGIWGGYQGQGAKTVLPARAGAKISFRIVPNQNPDQIAASLRKFIEERCPPGIEFELETFHGGRGVLFSLDSPYMKAASRAIARGFGREPVYIREGGSIPVVSTFYGRLGADTLLLGWGLDDDNTHSPNEKFSLADFQRGIRTSACLWHELGRLER
ncbi:MAG: dipeptidase [Pirellulales bacterium]